MAGENESGDQFAPPEALPDGANRPEGLTECAMSVPFVSRTAAPRLRGWPTP